MGYMRKMRGMKRGNYEYRMPEEEREVIDDPDLSDDEDIPWDFDREGSLGNEDEDEDEDD